MVWFFEPQCRSLHLFLLVHQNFSLSKWNLLQYRFCHFSLHCVNSTLNNAAFRLYPELWYECWIAQRPNKDHTCLHAPCHAFLSAFDWCFQSPSPSPFRRLFLASLPEPASLLRYHLYQKKKKKSGSGWSSEPPMWTAISVLCMALASSGTLVLHWGSFAHRRHLAMFKHIFQLPQQGLLLASTGPRPRMLHRAGSPTKKDLDPNANSAEVVNLPQI